MQPTSGGGGLTLQGQSQNGPIHKADTLWFVCIVLCSLRGTSPGAITDTQPSAGSWGRWWRRMETVCVQKERVVRVVEREASTGCQSSPGHSLSLLDRAQLGENGSPWDPERRKEGRWRKQGGGDCLPVSVTLAWFDIWYRACGIWMQIYFDCPTVW